MILQEGCDIDWVSATEHLFAMTMPERSFEVKHHFEQVFHHPGTLGW